MAKPICIIYFPDLFEQMGGRRGWIYEYMRYLNGEQSDGSISWGDRKDYWKDYYWFCFYKEGITEPELQVFHPKDWTEIDQNELKELIINHIKDIKHAT